MKKLYVILIIVVVVLSMKSSETFAQAGSLDTTFGNKGIDTTIFGGAYGQSVIIQPDKKIIVAGGGYNGSIYGVGMIRYNSDGSIDNTFGTKGKVYTDIGGISSWGNECKLQSDGKIVVTGISNTKSSSLFGGNIQNFLVVRYNSDGSLDNTFGNSGIVVTGFSQKNAQAGSLVIQTDGKIVAGGVVDGGSNGSVSWDFAIVRYNSDGTLDNTFGTSGKVITDFNKNNDIINSVKLQTDGKIVVAGPVGGSSSGTFYALARYNTDGSLDNSFGTGGKVTTSVTNGDDEAFSVVIMNDGKFIVTGGVGLDKVAYIGLIKYNTDGSLDASYGSGGIVTTHAGNAESKGYSLVAQSDNKIVICGVVADSGVSQNFLLTMRFNIDGTIDTLFGTKGKVKTVIGKKDDAGYSIALQTDKKIVVAGWTKDDNNNYNYAVVRYNGDCDPPVITTNAPQTICAGTGITLNGSGANTYTWSDGVTDGVFFIPTEGIHTYTVVGTNLTNCKGSATTTITVNGLPIVNAKASSNSVCSGGSVTLTGSGANSYSWSDGVSDGVAFVPSSSHTYTVTAADNKGCSDTDTVTIFVNTLPIVSANTSATAVCEGTLVTLSATSAPLSSQMNYAWTNGVSDGVAFVPSSTHTYTVTGTDDHSCSDTDTISIFVNTAPTVMANTSDKTVCNGASVTLSATSAPLSGQMNYVWTNGVSDGVAFVPSSTHTYTVTGTDDHGCSSSDTITVVVNAVATLSAVTANASADTVCAGVAVTLTGHGADSYLWSDAISDGVSFVPSTTHTYTLTGHFNNGCSSTATTTIHVNTVPTVSINASTISVCAGTSVTLSATSAPLSGQMNYAWTNGVSDGIAFVPSSTHTYTVTGTDNHGCSDTDKITIFVNTPPEVIANTSDKTVCNGASVILSGSSTSLNGQIFYTWSDNISDGVTFVPSSTHTYTVTGIDDHGCSSSDTITVVVNTIATLGAVTANASANTVCAGAAVTLTGHGADSYLWSDAISDGVSFVPSTTHTYTLTGHFNNGCSSTVTTTIHVNILPTVFVNVSSPTVCAGDSVTLSATSAPLSGQMNYVWTNGVSDGIAFVPSSTHTYTVTGTDNQGCSDTAMTSISVLQLPDVGITVFPSTTICLGDSLLLSGTNANTYTWSDNITDAVAFSPTITTYYTVTGRNLNSCTDTASILIIVDSCAGPIIGVGITDIGGKLQDVKIYPNPNSGSFTITANEGTYIIMDELGQTLQQFRLNSNNNYSVSIENLNSGIYFVVGINNNVFTREKIVVTK